MHTLSSFLLPPPHSVTIKVLRSSLAEDSSGGGGGDDLEGRLRLVSGALSAQAGNSSVNLKGFFKKSAAKGSSYKAKYCRRRVVV